jgi:hypothetical protein
VKEQSLCTKVYFKLVKNCIEACEMLRVACGKDTHFLVVSKIQSGGTCIADCSGCLLTGKINKNMHQVKELVLKNRRIIIFEVASIGKYNICVSSEHFQRSLHMCRLPSNSFPTCQA